MIESLLGLFIVLGMVAMLSGAGGVLPGVAAFDPLPILGYGGIAFTLAVGLLLIVDGLVRRRIARGDPSGQALRMSRVTVRGCLLVAALALGVPLAAEPLNVLRVDGFPIGYYLAAQGALIALVVLAFAWAARRNRIEAETPHE